MAHLQDFLGVLAVLLLLENIMCQSTKDSNYHISNMNDQNPFYNRNLLVKRNTDNAGNRQQISTDNTNNDENENVKNNIHDIFNIPTNHRHRRRLHPIANWPVGLQSPNGYFNFAQRFSSPPIHYPTNPQFPTDFYNGVYNAFGDSTIDQAQNRFPDIIAPQGYPQFNNFFIGLGHPQFTPWRVGSQWYTPLFFVPVYCNPSYLPPGVQPDQDGTTTVAPPVQPDVNMTLGNRFGSDRNWGTVDPTTRRPSLPNDINNRPQSAIPNIPNNILPPANPEGGDDENYTIRDISFTPVQPSRQPSVTPPPIEHGGDAPSIPQVSVASASSEVTMVLSNNGVVEDLNLNRPDENAIIPPRPITSRPTASRPVFANPNPSPPRKVAGSRQPARPPPTRLQPTFAPPPNVRDQRSRCVWAIISCCVPNSEQVQDDCFEKLGCAGPFWDRSPCSSEIAKAAIKLAREYNANS